MNHRQVPSTTGDNVPKQSGVDLDAADFRRALGHFCSGITIISAVVEGRPVGLTCQSFFSVSIDPPLVAFSIAKTSTSFPTIRRANACSISILSDSQHTVSDSFARTGTDKWASVAWHPGRSGHPVLDGALAWLECEFDSILAAGDHDLVVARVRYIGFDEGRAPLVYFRGHYGIAAADATIRKS